MVMILWVFDKPNDGMEMAISNLKKFSVAFVTFVCRIIAYYFRHSWLHNLMNIPFVTTHIFRSFYLAWKRIAAAVATAAACWRCLWWHCSFFLLLSSFSSFDDCKISEWSASLYAFRRWFQFLAHRFVRVKCDAKLSGYCHSTATYFKLVDWVCSNCLFRMHQVWRGS